MERVYPENAWVTPCELFKPYYGYTIANFILNQMETIKLRKLRVMEIGPGTGTFADSLLDFYKNYNLDLYRDCEYVFVEISPQLAEQCENLMRQNHKTLLETNKIKIFNGSILDFQRKINGNCFVVGLEILDNLPHDRLYFGDDGKLKEQVGVKIDYDSEMNEVLEEFKEQMSDDICLAFADLWNNMPTMDHIAANKVIKQEGLFKRIQEIFQIMKHKESMTNNIFAPTGALKVMSHINQYIPNHSLILADFDSFIMPKNSIKGINAPLVTNKLKDPTKWQTFDNYLIKRGQADICFPVDFFLLKHAYQKITGLQANVYKTSEFVDLFSLQSWCTTQNLFNPMRDEYFNTSFLTLQHSAMMNNYMGFTSVRDSKERLFASNLMPLPPKFAFQERNGRINWRQLMNVDLEKVTKEVDLKSLEVLLQNITYATLDKDDLDRLGDNHFIKLFRLTQYSIEYMLYTQNYLESLCSTLDVEYKQSYEKTAKMEEAIKKYQQELKLIRKELKIKQKTLSTYEYLMKLPVEQEQDVIKCKHCTKFFLSKQYLQKHYQRHHPEVDFFREFSDQSDLTLNDRVQQIVQQQTQNQQPKINQEELFEKIKGELFTSLNDNFKKIENEISQLKTKQNYQQIQDMLTTLDQKNQEEQRRIQESLSKPAKMLDDLKQDWGEKFTQQSASMKDIIQNSVNDALQKRKDERESRKKNNKSGEVSSDGGNDQRAKFLQIYEKQLKEITDQLQQQEKEKEDLQKQVYDQQKMIELKSLNEQELLKNKEEEESKRREAEIIKENLELELQKQQEQQRIREEKQKKQMEDLKASVAEEQRILNLKLSIEEQEQKKKEFQLKQQQEEEEEKKRQAKLLQEKVEIEKNEKLKKDEQEKVEKQKKEEQRLEKEKADQELIKKREEEQQKKKQDEEKKKKEEEERRKKIIESSDVEVIEEEEEEEKDDEDIEEEDDKKTGKPAQVTEDEKKIAKSKLKELIQKQQTSENFYEGMVANIKSLFSHPRDEIEAKIDTIKSDLYINQTTFLEKEFQTLKIDTSIQLTPQISTNRRKDLENVHDELKHLNKSQVDKINNSLQKRLSDQNYARYSALIENFINKTLK